MSNDEQERKNLWVVVRISRYDEEHGCGRMKPVFWHADEEQARAYQDFMKDDISNLVVFPRPWHAEPGFDEQYREGYRVPSGLDPALDKVVEQVRSQQLEPRQRSELETSAFGERDPAHRPELDPDKGVYLDDYRRRMSQTPKL